MLIEMTHDTPPINSEKAPEASLRLKFLLIASDCPEARLAAYFTARRARRSGAAVLLLAVVEPAQFGHWAAVNDEMRAEGWEKAGALMDEFADVIEAETGEPPERLIREGRIVDEIRGLIGEDPSIAILFLGASADASGPGPLVEALSARPVYLGARPIPVTVVPGTLTRDDLRKIS